MRLATPHTVSSGLTGIESFASEPGAGEEGAAVGAISGDDIVFRSQERSPSSG